MGLYSQWEYTDGRAASVLLFWALLLVGRGSLPGGISLTTRLGGPELTVDISCKTSIRLSSHRLSSIYFRLTDELNMKSEKVPCTVFQDLK